MPIRPLVGKEMKPLLLEVGPVALSAAFYKSFLNPLKGPIINIEPINEPGIKALTVYLGPLMGSFYYERKPYRR